MVAFSTGASSEFDYKRPKGQCPSCHEKGAWRFLKTGNNRLPDEFGICDKGKCGHSNWPKKGASVRQEKIVEKPAPEVIYATPERTKELLDKTNDFNNALHVLAHTLGVPSSHLQKWRVATDGNAIAYLHFNKAGQLCNAKWMPYHPNGKRNHDRKPWTFPQPHEEKNQEYKFCLYGEHLLSDDRARPVCLVESEKSAVLASYFYPQFDWLACGAANGVADHKIAPLHNRLVYWLRDADGGTQIQKDGVPVFNQNGSPRLSIGGRHNTSVRNLKAFGIQHAEIDLFPDRNDGYDIADALQDGLRPVLAPPTPSMTATLTDSPLNEAQQRFVRQQADKGTARDQINQLLKVTSNGEYSAAIDELLDAPAPTIGTFWARVPGRKVGTTILTLNLVSLKEWLSKDRGFYRLPDADNTTYALVRVEGNIVSLATRQHIKDEVQNYIEGLPLRFDDTDRDELHNLVMSRTKSLFDQEMVGFLPYLTSEFLRDTADSAFFFLANCWVEVTANDKPKARGYDELPALIWKSQVRRFNYSRMEALSYEQCDFHLFMKNTLGGDPQRIEALQLALGYLLHLHKDPSNSKAILLLDADAAPGQADGRTGKSLFLKAVEQLRNVVTVDGRTFRFDDPFKWQLMRRDTDVWFFDEWQAHQDFAPLFAYVSGDWQVNCKGLPSYSIPYAQSPKIAIASNDMITGKGGSYEARKIEVALDGYYTAQHQPTADFGREFFNAAWDADADEWTRFLNLAFSWVQLYLRNGRKLKTVQLAQVEQRKITQDTSEEFMQWLDHTLKDRKARGFASDKNSKGQYCVWPYLDFAGFVSDHGKYHAGHAKGKKELTLIGFGKFLTRAGLTSGTEKAQSSHRDKQYFAWPNQDNPGE
jgi:hypothetical protein